MLYTKYNNFLCLKCDGIIIYLLRRYIHLQETFRPAHSFPDQPCVFPDRYRYSTRFQIDYKVYCYCPGADTGPVDGPLFPPDEPGIWAACPGTWPVPGPVFPPVGFVGIPPGPVPPGVVLPPVGLVPPGAAAPPVGLVVPGMFVPPAGFVLPGTLDPPGLVPPGTVFPPDGFTPPGQVVPGLPAEVDSVGSPGRFVAPG